MERCYAISHHYGVWGAASFRRRGRPRSPRLTFSAAIKTETIPSIAVHRAAQHGVLLKSRGTGAELIEVLDRPYLARLIVPESRAPLLELMALAELVPITEHVVACRDLKNHKPSHSRVRDELNVSSVPPHNSPGPGFSPTLILTSAISAGAAPTAYARNK